MPTIIGLLFAVVLLFLAYWAITRLMAAFGIGEPLHTVVIVLLVILGVWYILGVFGALGSVRLR